jgi:hypothetical protein
MKDKGDVSAPKTAAKERQNEMEMEMRVELEIEMLKSPGNITSRLRPTNFDALSPRFIHILLFLGLEITWPLALAVA